MKTDSDATVRVRVIVIDPPKGLTYRLQRGRDELVAPVSTTAAGASFEFELRLGTRAGGAPNFLGDFVQGPPDKRFVYINCGTYAGQAGAPWSGRAKVPLAGIGRRLLDEAVRTDGVLTAEFEGTDRNGRPALATVRLIGDGWRLEPR